MNTLINLDDIQRRYAENPEPQEVTQTRERITEAFSQLQFIEEGHQYFLPQPDGTKVELPSVSSIVEQWVPQIDWDEKCEQKAKKENMPKEDLQRLWHEKNIVSTSCGHKTHFFGENLMNLFIGREDKTRQNLPFQYTPDRYIIPYSPKEWAVNQYYMDILANLNVFPVMPEAMIYTNLNDTFRLKRPYAGTFDILMAYRMNGEIQYAIHDFKTNADLYKDYARSRGVMMLQPFDGIGLYDEPLSHYAIQLSLYSLGLMQLGIKPVDRVLIWLKDNGQYEKVRVPDLTDTLLNLLQK